MFLIRGSIEFFYYLDKFPWISNNNLLFKRELFKIGVMTSSYNSTSFGRIEDFYNYLYEFALSSMIYDFINKNDLKHIASFVEYFFLQFKDTYLKDFQKLNNIAEIIAKI